MDRVARILVFKIRPSQEILKIRDGTPLEKKRVAGILVFKIRPSQEILKIRDVARFLVSKIRPSQEILKIRDGTPLQKKRVARFLVSKIRPSQEILKIRDGTPLQAEEILTHRKGPQNGSVWHFSSKLDVPSNLLRKKRVARILAFKIRPSQEILKLRDGTTLEPEEILTHKKSPRNGSVWHISSKLGVPSNVLHKKRVAQILVFKIRPSQEILKIRDGTPSEAEEILTYRKKPSKWIVKKRVARFLVSKIRPSQEILKIRDGTPLQAEEILTHKKGPQNGSVWHFSSKLDVPSNVLRKKRVARILVFKIRPSQEILKIRDGTPSEAEEILTYRKKPSKWIVNKRVARILVFKIRPSQEILKLRDGTTLEPEEILTHKKSPRNGSVWHFSSKLDVPSNVLQKKRVARILFFKIWPSHEILKIRDGILVFKISPSQEILKIRDATPSRGGRNFNTQKKALEMDRVARFLVSKIRPSQEILKIRDGTPLEAEEVKKRVARFLVSKIRPSQEILKIRDGTPLQAEEILTHRKGPQNGSVWHFSSKLDVPSNVLHKKRVAQILVFKIRPSQEILKIRDVARILVFKIRPSQEILKLRDGTTLEPEEILTHKKSPRNGSKRVKKRKRVARFLVSKIRPSQEILKIRDGTPLEAEEVAGILVFKIRPSQEILKLRDGTTLEPEEILTHKKSPRNGSVWHFSSKLDVPSNVLQKKRVARILFFKIWPSHEILKIRDGTPLEKKRKKRVARFLVSKIRPSQEILKIRDGTPLEAEEVARFLKKRVARFLVSKIRPSQEILKIRDGTPLQAEEILTHRKGPQNGSVWHFSSKLDVPSNLLRKKRVARILVFKIRPSQEILKLRDGTTLEPEEILTHKKSPRNGSVWHISSKLGVPSNVLHKKRVAQILVFKIRPSQEILKIRDGTPSEAEEILTYRKKPSKWIVKKRVARFLVSKIRPSQEILKIRDGTPLQAEEILTHRKGPQNGSVWHFSSKLDVPSNVLRKKRVARILVFKIRPSQEILKIRDGTPSEKKRVAGILVFKIRPSQEILKLRDGTTLEPEEILTHKKSPRNGSVWHFSSKLDVPSNVLQKKRVARILFFKIWPSHEILKIRDVKKRVARFLVSKIRPSQEILKIRDGTPLEAEEVKKRVARFLVSKIRPSQEILKIRDVARFLVSKIRPSQEILKIRDGTPLQAEEILTHRKGPQNGSVWHFSSKLDVPSNLLRKKRVARILVFKIRPSQEILKLRDGTTLEPEEILTHKKSPRNGSVWHISSKLGVPSNVLHKKRVAQILVFKIRPSQEILKIRDGTPSEAEEILTYRKKPSKWIVKKRVARFLVSKIRPSQEILKIRDGTPLQAEEILTHRKGPQNGSVWHFSSKLDVPSNVLRKKRVARILVFKIRPSQEILKIRDGTPSEAEEILTYRKKPSKWIVARILVFKIRPSQEILKLRDGTTLEPEEILTHKKSPRNGSVWHFSSKLDVPSNVLQKKRVARILFFKILAGILVFKISPSQEILKIRDATPSRVARFLVSKIRPSQEILKIRDGTPLEAEEVKKRVARFLVSKIRPSQEILKIRDGTPLQAEEILTHRKGPQNGSVWHFSSKLDVPSNVLHKKRVAQILVFKIRPSQEILKIRDDTPSENKRVAWILVFKIRPSQEILKLRDGTTLEPEEILTHKKSPRNGSVWHFSSKLDVPSNVLQKKRVARILFFKIWPSHEILKIRDGTPLEKKRVAGILVFKIRPSQEILKIRDATPSRVKKIVARFLVSKIRPSQEILKIRDGTPLQAEEILTHRKGPQNGSVWHFSSKLDVPSNVLRKKRVARILVFKIRPSQEILKIRDGTPSEAEEILTYRKKPSKWIVARILVFKIRPSQEILKLRDGTTLEPEEILTHKKSPRNGSVWHFSSKLDVPSNVLQKKRVARILFFKIWPSHEILKIRDVAGILVFKISPSQEILKIQMDRVARFLVSKIRPSQEILKIRDGTPLEAEEVKKRVARFLVSKIRPSQEILKIRDGTPLQAEEILTHRKGPQNGSVWHFSSKLDVPSNVLHKKRVAQILVFKIRPSQEILKIRDDTPSENKRVAWILVFKIRPSQEILKLRDGTTLEPEEILTHKKSPRNGSVWHFSSKLDVPSNVLQKKRVARILFFKIWPSHEILKIRDGTPLEKKRVARFLVSKIRPSQEILKIRDGTPLEAEEVAGILVFKIRPSQEILKLRDGTTLDPEEILTHKKSPRNGSVWHFSSKLDVPSNVLQKKRVARILFFKIWPSHEILKIRDVKKRVARFLVSKIRPSQEILKIRDEWQGFWFSKLGHLKKFSKFVMKKRVARFLVSKIRPSQEILKLRDGTTLEPEEILTHKKSPRNGSVWHISSKLGVPSNVLHKKRVAQILVFKIRPSQEILKIRDGTPSEAEEILTYRKKPSKWIGLAHF
ncbi:hypothetical protein OROMI_013759 [Orobanche minor]